MHRYTLADVFTGQRFGGNQLAVFPDAESIPPAVMQQIARELNLSETVFVLPPADSAHTCRLRFMTPQMELPFAGHPTIGTACILAAMGEVSLEGGTAEVVFEVGVGPVRVQIRRVGGRLRAQFEVPSPATIGPPPPPKRDLARMLAIEEHDILDGDSAPQTRSVGVPFLFITVRDRAALGQLRMNTSVWEDILSQHWAPHVYVITRDREADPTLVRARMFAPAMGITEDPATGVAASALPGYLRTPEQISGTFTWRIEQGVEMGRPSVIDVEADLRDGAVVRTRVGGECVLVGRGELDLGE